MTDMQDEEFVRQFPISDSISVWIDALKTPVYQWSVFWRKLYVITWPLSTIVRGLLYFPLIGAWLTSGAFEYSRILLICKWRGIRNPWGD